LRAANVAGRQQANAAGQSNPASRSAPIRTPRGHRLPGRQTSSIGEGSACTRVETAPAPRSLVGSTPGDGAIYALRRRLYRPLPEDAILDDVLTPMRAVLAGYRVVFSERAIAFDRAALDARAERRRKIRTLAGNVQILWQEPRLLVPFINPVWLQYMSHKLGRLLVPYALLGLLAANVALAPGSLFYALTLAIQCALYLLAAYGAWLDGQRVRRARAPPPAGLPSSGCARGAYLPRLNYSAVAGVASALTRGRMAMTAGAAGLRPRHPPG
jgi:hypothetical protein